MYLSDWDERKRVLVSAGWGDQQLYYSVDQTIRHQMLVCCISAYGDAYCSLRLSANRSVMAIFDHGVPRISISK
jgi:hypothetical protein